MGKKIKRILNIIYKSILEILYPKSNHCIICDDEAEGICIRCKSKITKCSKDEYSVGFYKGVLKELILKFKYKKDFNAGDVLVELLEEKLKLYDEECVLTFIPIGREALKKRGFNQCEYLAKEIGFRNKYEVIEVLKKIKDTKVQKTLDKEERAKNMKDAFSVINKELISGKKIIIIDDVVTTGATLAEAKKILETNGALQINTLTIAKTDI